MPRPFFAVYRLAIAALALADLIYAGMTHPEGFWVIHLVNWVRIFCLLHFLLGGLSSAFESCCSRKSSDKYEYSVLRGEFSLLSGRRWYHNRRLGGGSWAEVKLGREEKRRRGERPEALASLPQVLPTPAPSPSAVGSLPAPVSPSPHHPPRGIRGCVHFDSIFEVAQNFN